MPLSQEGMAFPLERTTFSREETPFPCERMTFSVVGLLFRGELIAERLKFVLNYRRERRSAV
jgi:hypothetical protein